jgi:hypothetical protein
MLKFRVEVLALAAAVMCLAPPVQAQDSAATGRNGTTAAPVPMYGGYGAAPYYGPTAWDYGYPSGYVTQPGAYANAGTAVNGGTTATSPGIATIPNTGPTYYPGPAYGSPGCGPTYGGCEPACEPDHHCCLGRLFGWLCFWRHGHGFGHCGPCGCPSNTCGPVGCGPYGY